MLIKMEKISEEVSQLLALAASANKLASELENYLNQKNRTLYLYYQENCLVGCIGIDQLASDQLEITHIATAVSNRGQGIGRSMIDFVLARHAPTVMFAETDAEALGFYQQTGFESDSLGEKYPGVERFYCSYKKV